MKTKILLFLFASSFFITAKAQDENISKPSMAILNVDTKGIKNKEYALLYPEEAGNILRIEMEKLNIYEILDRYDAEYIIKQKKLVTDNCYGKLCLTEVGRELGVDKMLSGTMENINGNIYY